VTAPWQGAGFEVIAYGRPEGMTIEHCVLSAAFATRSPSRRTRTAAIGCCIRGRSRPPSFFPASGVRASARIGSCSMCRGSRSRTSLRRTPKHSGR
jgi:hypothetical protein